MTPIAPRWFVVRDAKGGGGPTLLQPRWAMSYLRGPMTRQEIRRARSTPPPAPPYTELASGATEIAAE